MPPHKSRSTSITCGEGQQNGAGVASPLRLLLRGRLRLLLSNRSAFCLSRQRHGAGMKQKRLHRHATAADCGSCASTKNPCRTNHPAPAFSLPHTTLESKSGLVAARPVYYPCPPPACQATRGRAALLLSRSPATLPVRPLGLPKAILLFVMRDIERIFLHQPYME